MKKWFVKNKKFDYGRMSEKFNISPLICKLLVNRSITEERLISSFIDSNLDHLHDPKKMKDVVKAASILKAKIETHKRIRIIGDYDVDGVISTYILFMALSKCGADVDYDIPDRIKDGYGINRSIIERSKSEGIDTIITCDNGISAIEPIQYAKDLGLTVIVTDHHDIPFIEDEESKRTFISSCADAIINPKQEECDYEFKSLCGAGVAFKLIQVLYEKMKIPMEESFRLIEFVAIATVCDVVDLIDENRIFVKQGLEAIKTTNNLGLMALMKESGIESKSISVYHLGFIIGPCINASGRLDNAKKGLRLLIAEDREEVDSLAKELYELNQDRKDMTIKGVEKAIEIIEGTDIKNHKVFVIYMPEVHESLAGIIAGRIKEQYHVPTIVLTKSEEGIKGSGRSIDCYNMFEELLKCKDLLRKFGGHPMAAGLSLDEDQVENLREKLNQVTDLTEEDLIPTINLDMGLEIDRIDYELIEDIERLSPFGKGNNKPLFGDKNIRVIKGHILGQNRNVLKLKLLSKQGKYMDGIYFGDIKAFEELITTRFGSDELERLYQGSNTNIVIDIAFYPTINTYMERSNIQLTIEDFR